MKETTLVHIEKDGCVLMLHRISKKNDINHGKWIGVGGKFEWGETPEACMRREVREETGLIIDTYRYCGIVTFVSDDDEMEYMHLFVVDGFHDREGGRVVQGALVPGCSQIRLNKCEEGELEWLEKGMLTKIPHWAGDRIFLSLILDRKVPFFSMKLVYRKGELVHASMNEHNCLVTDRLILRPWIEQDASDLYGWAKSPKIGPAAGWLPHTDVKNSRDVIRNVLTRPEIYAIVLRDTCTAIGSVGLQNFRLTGKDGGLLTYFDERQSEDPLFCSRPGSMSEGLPEEMSVEAELGYWLAEPFRHRGIITEAARAVLDHAVRDLGIRRVWADYYEGNEASHRVMERLGFHFHHVEEQRYIESLKEFRTANVQVIDL